MESCEYMSSLEGEPEKNTFSKFTPFKKKLHALKCAFLNSQQVANPAAAKRPAVV